MKFEAADRWLKSRLQMPTALNTRGLAELESGIRAHAFFSARVAEARVLDAIREVSDRYSRGELDLATARATIKERLGTRRAPGSKEDSRLTDICSTARLDLILGQNARMAYAVGEYEQGMDTMARRLFPAWRYVRSTAASPRAKHAAYAGRVWMKDDPVWRSIFPPSDFGCRCSVEEVSADEIDGGSARVEGRTADKDVPPHAKSGFYFNPEEGYTTIKGDLVKDAELRCETLQELETRFGYEKDDSSSGMYTAVRQPEGNAPATERRKHVMELEENARKAGVETPYTLDPARLREQRAECRRTQPEYSRKAAEAYLELPSAGQKALNLYTTGDLQRLNQVARGNKTYTPEQQEQFDALAKALGKLPRFQGTLYRGMSFENEEELDNYVRSLASPDGAVGFTSTSWDQASAMDYAMKGKGSIRVVFRIERAAQGAFLGPVSCAPSDHEVLYSPGARFLRVRVKRNEKDGTLIYDLREM